VQGERVVEEAEVAYLMTATGKERKWVLQKMQIAVAEEEAEEAVATMGKKIKQAAQEEQIGAEVAAAEAEVRMSKRSAKEGENSGQKGHLDVPSFYEPRQLFKKEQ
jgi:hypothetical protein